MKFTVAQKGFLLAGVPLAFEFVLFLGLLALLNQAEVTADLALQSREMVNNIAPTLTDYLALVDAGDSNRLFGIGGEQEYNDCLSRTQADLMRLREMAASDPAKLGVIQHFTEKVQTMDAQVKHVLSVGWPMMKYPGGIRSKLPPGQVKAYWQASNALGEYNRFRHDIIEDTSTVEQIKAYGERDNRLIEGEPERQSDLRRIAKAILGISLMLSISLSLLSALFFSRQFSKRLAVIADNNSRFIEGKQLHPVVPGSDEIVDLDVSFHEAAEELRAVERQEKAIQQLRQQVITTITRDLKTPLGSISSFLHSSEPSAVDEQTRDLHGVAVRSLDRMSMLVNELVDLEQIKEGKLPLNCSLVSLGAAARQAQEIVASVAAEKKIAISVQGDTQVSADERRIVQVLVNLLGNAIKFSPENSAVEILIEESDGAVRVSVKDHGRGIPEKMLKDIFSPFKQLRTDDAIKLGGYGLGLAICRALVESHGGKISVTSEEGAGSTFVVHMPSLQPVEPQSVAI